jgi:hypothetical protein
MAKSHSAVWKMILIVAIAIVANLFCFSAGKPDVSDVT